jgi:lipoprotein-releasing system permease protein
MTAELYIARRYLFHRHQGAWGWLIGWLATGSVALGVAALIVTLSVMTGFREDIRQKILGIQPAIVLTPFQSTMSADLQINEVLNQNKQIVEFAPFISGQVLIGRGSQTSGAVIKGIDPEKEGKIANLDGKILHAKIQDLNAQSTNNKPTILLGIELARSIGARPGDNVWIVTPGSLNLMSLSLPQARTFEVLGFVQSGLYDYDSSLAYVNLPLAQSIFDMAQTFSGIGIKIKDLDDADRMAQKLQLEFNGKYWVRSWLSLNKNLFSALKLEKMVMFTILTLITIVASIMIVSNLLLTISQRIKEIGILRAMGASSAFIRRIFLFQGLLMGFIGTFMGLFLGLGVALILSKTNFIRLPADVYYIDRLPIQIEFMDILSVLIACFVIVLVATIYPAQRAAKLDPVEAIRYG